MAVQNNRGRGESSIVAEIRVTNKRPTRAHSPLGLPSTKGVAMKNDSTARSKNSARCSGFRILVKGHRGKLTKMNGGSFLRARS